jgi:hypothetical protein
MDQRKSLGIEALVTVVVANARARPIGRDNLGWPKVTLGESGFPAGCGSTQNNH